MEILNLTLLAFRNFSAKRIIFDQNLTIIIGPNGSGKSNILEAIGLLAGIRSPRVETDLDLVKFGKSETKVEGRVESSSYAKASEDKQSGKSTLTINFQVIDELHVKKAYLVDSIKKRYGDLATYFSLVIFEPADLDLVCGSPSLRRHHLDTFLASCDRGYWRATSLYNKVVVRRNKVLVRIAEGKSKASELDFWDGRLLEHGKYISQKREELFEFLNPSASSGQVLFTKEHLRGGLGLLGGGGIGDFSWQLKQSLLSQEKLLRNRERDIAAGMTLSGPHRDDFRFMFGGRQPGEASGPEGRDLEFFGSRGEQRMAVLALKLAELEYVTQSRGSRPVLALDDIFSELDWEHREAVLSVVGKQQTIITAAERESLPKEIFKKAKVIELG